MVQEEHNSGSIPPIVMLHIFSSFSFGGQQSRFAELTKGLGNAFQHHVVSLDGDYEANSLVGESAPINYHNLRFHKSSFVSFANLMAFRKIAAKVKPDILCTYNWGSIEAVIACRFNPSIRRIHFEDGFGPGEAPDAQPFRRVLARRLLLGGATVVVPSQVLENVALNKWKLKREGVRRIANGVDFERFQAAPATLRPAVTIGTLGALRAEKNQARLMRAFQSVGADNTSLLSIIGAGPERDALVALAKTLHCEERISIPGPTSKPEEAMREFDIFALSSDTEQAPLSLMEAMAAGLPVVATDVGDVANMVSAQNRAFVTPPGDDEAFTNALAQLLKNPGLRAELGAANRKKAKADFSLEHMITEHGALYRSIVKN